MGWRPTRHERFHVVERIRGSAGGEDRLSDEQARTLREGILGAAVADGLISETDMPSWERSAAADLHGVAQLLGEMRTARRGTPNSDVAAAARRPEPEGQASVRRAR